MTDTIRFPRPGRQFGTYCEKCKEKIKGHTYIDVDDRGRIVLCSVSKGIDKPKGNGKGK